MTKELKEMWRKSIKLFVNNMEISIKRKSKKKPKRNSRAEIKFHQLK